MQAGGREWLLSHVATSELIDILRRTELGWGRNQREDFQRLFNQSLTTLASAPEIGKRRDDIARELRSHPVVSYVIYYWTNDREIEVAHILHEKQDPTRQDWG